MVHSIVSFQLLFIVEKLVYVHVDSFNLTKTCKKLLNVCYKITVFPFVIALIEEEKQNLLKSNQAKVCFVPVLKNVSKRLRMKITL